MKVKGTVGWACIEDVAMICKKSGFNLSLQIVTSEGNRVFAFLQKLKPSIMGPNKTGNDHYYLVD